MALLCLSALPARAVGPEVRDSAGLFSSSAVRQADETIRTIQRDFRKELLVETFASVPENRKEAYASNREEFFANFVKERAQAARLDGIYVLVMKEQPPHRLRVQVGVGQATRQRAFLTADRDELVRLFQTSFREEKNDEALRSGVAFVERTLRSKLGSSQPGSPGAFSRQQAPAAAPEPSNPIASFLVLGLFVVGGIMLVGFLMRMIRGGMGGGGMPGAGGMGGGGGFLSSVLGGIGGAMAGSWLYDRFFSGNSHSTDSGPSNQMDGSASDVGGDYSSSGGDADYGGGGGDVGGGGDFGGGGSDA